MPEEDLQEGDLVEIKSGGFDMVIERIETKTKLAFCVYYDGKEIKHDQFYLPALKKKK